MLYLRFLNQRSLLHTLYRLPLQNVMFTDAFSDNLAVLATLESSERN